MKKAHVNGKFALEGRQLPGNKRQYQSVDASTLRVAPKLGFEDLIDASPPSPAERQKPSKLKAPLTPNTKMEQMMGVAMTKMTTQLTGMMTTMFQSMAQTNAQAERALRERGEEAETQRREQTERERQQAEKEEKEKKAEQERQEAEEQERRWRQEKEKQEKERIAKIQEEAAGQARADMSERLGTLFGLPAQVLPNTCMQTSSHVTSALSSA